jgi:putative restriction endonuclease
MPRTFGEIAGVPVGSTFPDRTALSRAGVHRPPQHGISGSQAEGADSIVVSGGYEDDEDYGDVIVYTGAGGRDPVTGRQIANQELTNQNLALALSATDGLPVRVVRGRGGDSAHAPTTGYRYDGLFRVDDFWEETGRSGFKVVRYRLVKLSAEPVALGGPMPPLGVPGPAPRAAAQTQRIIRNTAVTQRVKVLHEHRCQVCDAVVQTATGPYAEGAHIRPLGRPHDGPDIESNVLCLCPTDHVRLDYGGIVLTDDLQVIDALTGAVVGPLRTVAGHAIDRDQIRYQRQMRTFEAE